jgi:alkylation response protein AidB-like acyl-CoA dehydrogenase
VKDPTGKFYVVNGEKKWITNGVFCDFFTVAVRTGGEGAGGISLLLLERGMKGLETKQMKCMGVWPSGTTYITMEDVHVPVENLIGAENQGAGERGRVVRSMPASTLRVDLTDPSFAGFKYIMYNFNHERWALTIQASRFSRVCLEEAFKYAMKRKTFGKTLLEHPVIRAKIAEMARQVECTHAQLENITYQMCTMSKKDAMEKLGACWAWVCAPPGILTYSFQAAPPRCSRRRAPRPLSSAPGRRPRSLVAPPTCAAARARRWSASTARSGRTPSRAAARRLCWILPCAR